ncbi:hypothetical protein ABTZ93_35740 [Streptomyces sp. NPDC097941]|uniref:hypothetical protein n=1 Tax=Streptomyces sp. NPDC097941 TaxID=3155685 RepID=UPI0033225259
MTSPDDTLRKWTPQWSPEGTDPALPPITLITDPQDQPAHTTTALAAHQPALGRIAVHPTPLATAPAYLAHDLIRAVGKHLPPPDTDPPWWTSNADESWRIAVAWTGALGINHYVVCRAHRITSRHLEHLMALRERTRIRLTLIASGPPPAALTDILNAVAHRQLDTLEAAHHHLNTDPDATPPPADRYPWWQSAPFPGPDDEPWYQMPPRPRHPAGQPGDTTAPTRRAPTRRPSQDSPPPTTALTHADHDVVARRIHTRIAHPIHAAAVAVRALMGYGIDQLPQITVPTTHRPRADLPADLPGWARLLQDAARLHTDLQRFPSPDLPAHLSGDDRALRLPAWEMNEVAQATATCRLLAAPARRPNPPTRKRR